jgi:membrane-associated protease RseP (regulator of RpoE activity)
MRIHRVLPVLVALIVLAPAGASAQVPATAIYTTNSSRGMLGFYSVPVEGAAAYQRVIVDVVPESPAQKAGLAEGDTLLRINGLAASPQVMSAPFEPGDTVVLRIRRDGRERDLTMVAAERATQYRITFPDSIGQRYGVYMNRMRANLDTVHALANIRVHRFGDDSITAVIIGADTLHIARGVPSRIMLAHPDSMPIMSLFPDSISRFYRAQTLPRFFTDSAGVRIFTPGEGRTFTFDADSNFARGLNIMSANAVFGMRAVAGAELAPLNDELAEYFGATDGVLVLNAAERTPAERAGLRGGDVIVRAGDTPVRTIAELRRAIDAVRGEPVTLRVLRHGRNVDITLR